MQCASSSQDASIHSSALPLIRCIRALHCTVNTVQWPDRFAMSLYIVPCPLQIQFWHYCCASSSQDASIHTSALHLVRYIAQLQRVCWGNAQQCHTQSFPCPVSRYNACTTAVLHRVHPYIALHCPVRCLAQLQRVCWFNAPQCWAQKQQYKQRQINSFQIVLLRTISAWMWLIKMYHRNCVINKAVKLDPPKSAECLWYELSLPIFIKVTNI